MTTDCEYEIFDYVSSQLWKCRYIFIEADSHILDVRQRAHLIITSWGVHIEVCCLLSPCHTVKVCGNIEFNVQFCEDIERSKILWLKLSWSLQQECVGPGLQTIGLTLSYWNLDGNQKETILPFYVSHVISLWRSLPDVTYVWIVPKGAVTIV